MRGRAQRLLGHVRRQRVHVAAGERAQLSTVERPRTVTVRACECPPQRADLCVQASGTGPDLRAGALAPRRNLHRPTPLTGLPSRCCCCTRAAAAASHGLPGPPRTATSAAPRRVCCVANPRRGVWRAGARRRRRARAHLLLLPPARHPCTSARLGERGAAWGRQRVWGNAAGQR